VGYNNGFQIWDMSAVHTQESKVSELVSVQGFKVKDICVFDPLPANEIGKSPVDRPVIGIVSGEETNHPNWPNNKLLLYSLRTATWKGIELGASAFAIHSNSTTTVVVYTFIVHLLNI
jgi:hypothetical protein